PPYAGGKPLLGLRIVAGSSADCQPRFVDLYFDRAIVVWTVGPCRIEGQNVIRIGVGRAARDPPGYVVTRVKHLAAALRGKNLQGQVSRLRLIRLLQPLQELLVIDGAQAAR